MFSVYARETDVRRDLLLSARMVHPLACDVIQMSISDLVRYNLLLRAAVHSVLNRNYMHRYVRHVQI